MCSPMAGPAIREVLGPASPFVARNPLATGRLPANDCCMLRPGHAHAGPRGTHVPLSVRLHVRARAIRLLKRADTNRARDPARRALRYHFFMDLTGVPAATTSSPGGGARDVRAPPPAEIRRVQVNSGMIDHSIWCAAAPDPPIRFRSRALGLARARLVSSSRLTPDVSPRSVCAEPEMSAEKRTRSFILV